jgi:uncharacterized protein YprB with RNaseH-like and TPR domain
MIRRRFCVFHGIGPSTERSIWDAGIPDWNAFLLARRIDGLSPGKQDLLRTKITEWNHAVERQDPTFFARNLKRLEHWNLFEVFGNGIRYLDIETTGLSPDRHQVTVVGIHDGRQFRALIRGIDLSPAALQQALDGCKLLVSYFGSAFDVPFLAKAFPEIEWNLPHYDLCFAGRRVELTGGLKVVEKKLGISRSASLQEVDGHEAVRLWNDYQRSGNTAALDKLIAYNRADTANLAIIAPIMYQRLCQKVIS